MFSGSADRCRSSSSSSSSSGSSSSSNASTLCPPRFFYAATLCFAMYINNVPCVSPQSFTQDCSCVGCDVRLVSLRSRGALGLGVVHQVRCHVHSYIFLVGVIWRENCRYHLLPQTTSQGPLPAVPVVFSGSWDTSVRMWNHRTQKMMACFRS